MKRRASGRHSKHLDVPVPGAVRAFGMIDARTQVEHVVLEETAAVHRQAGCYLARCGAEVLAASLTEPGRGRCPECTQ